MTTHESVLLASIAQLFINLLFDRRLPLRQEPPLPLADVGIKRPLALPPLNLVRHIPLSRRLGKDVRVPSGDLVDKGLHELFAIVVVGHDGRVTDEDRGGSDVAGRVGQRGD
jgi:hypothetical protein